ncbi:MAG: hypothetical protein ABSG89_08715 [Bacteroidales bacterium]|jgi:hypothetical protein
MKKNDKDKFLKCSKLEDIPPNIKESLGGMGRLKIIEKDTVCVEVKLDDTFPKGDITLKEKRVIENLLERLYIDLEYDRYVIFSMKELISLITAITREGCNSHMAN